MRPILEKESERYGRGDNSMKPLYQRHYRASGFTLIEIMIVVALMALILGVGIFGLGIIGRADVNGEALRFSSAVRYTFNMAATSNKTLQLKIDFENRRSNPSVFVFDNNYMKEYNTLYEVIWRWKQRN